MSGVDVAKIRARADAATEGPWAYEDDQAMLGGYDVTGPRTMVTYRSDRGSVDLEADAAFIAHARTDVPALLDALAEAERQRDDALAKIAEIRDTMQREHDLGRISLGGYLILLDRVLIDARAALADPEPTP